MRGYNGPYDYGDDVDQVLVVLDAVFGEEQVHPHRLLWHWHWRGVAFGPCPRCRWPSHTLAPNGSPFHPFCWGNHNEPSSFDQWVRRKDGTGEWGNSAPELVDQADGERQWCATGRTWFEPTAERLAVCAEHAESMVRRWRNAVGPL